MKQDIRYVERKIGLTGPARICRVTTSRTGKTLYVDGRALVSLKGRGYKENYVDCATGDTYWVSRPKRDGQDTLYPGVVQVDAEVRETYWREVRGQPQAVGQATYRSLGKYRK